MTSRRNHASARDYFEATLFRANGDRLHCVANDATEAQEAVWVEFQDEFPDEQPKTGEVVAYKKRGGKQGEIPWELRIPGMPTPWSGLTRNVKMVITNHGCCRDARLRQCTCMYSFECPKHGRKCVGTHNSHQPSA